MDTAGLSLTQDSSRWLLPPQPPGRDVRTPDQWLPPAPCEPVRANPQPDGAACPACTRGDPNWHPLHSGMLPPCRIPAGAAGTGSIPPGRLSQTTALRAIQGQLDPSLWDMGCDPMWMSHVQTRGTFMTPLPVPRCTHQVGMHHPVLCRQVSRSYISVS